MKSTAVFSTGMGTLVAFTSMAWFPACGTSDAADELIAIRFQSKWVPQAQFAGYYVAGGHPRDVAPSNKVPLENGKSFYEAEGLDVTVLPGDTVNTAMEVALGNADFGTDWIGNFLQQIEANGLDLLHIAQIYQRPGYEMIALRSSGITTIADFSGKKLGVWPYGNDMAPHACLLVHNLTSTLDEGVSNPDVETTEVDFDPSGVFPGTVQITSAMVYNELHQIIGLGYPLADLVRLPAADNDCALLEDFIFTSAELLSQRDFKGSGVSGQQIAERFLRATLKGWRWATDTAHQQEATEVVLGFCADTCKGSGTTTAEQHQTWQMSRVAELVQPGLLGGADKVVGCVELPAYDRTRTLLTDLSLIQAGTGQNAIRFDVLDRIGVACAE